MRSEVEDVLRLKQSVAMNEGHPIFDVFVDHWYILKKEMRWVKPHNLVEAYVDHLTIETMIR